MPTNTQYPEDETVTRRPSEDQSRRQPEIPGRPTPDRQFSGIGTSQAAIEERWLDLPEGHMRYLRAGSGPAIILVHGLMGYSFSWRFTIPALAPYATVYAIDNLGAGFSTSNAGMDCAVRATAQRVLRFADTLGIDSFDLLGTSHGGGVAIVAAAICAEEVQRQSNGGKKHDSKTDGDRIRDEATTANIRDRLRRLVLVAPVNPWSPHGRRLAPFIGTALGSFIFRHTIEGNRSFDVRWLSRLFADPKKIPADSLEGYRQPVLKNHGFGHGLRIVKNWTSDLAEIEAALPKIRDYPTLLMWGTKDAAVAFRSSEPLRNNFLDARLVAFEGVGHLPYEEAPEGFNRALIEFLRADVEVLPMERRTSPPVLDEPS